MSRKKRITVEQATKLVFQEGFSDALIDVCGLWKRQPDWIKKKCGGKFVWYIDRDYDETIAYIEVEP